MFDIQNYGSFVFAILIFQLVPGAGTIAILHAVARDGKSAGMAAVFGTLAADFLFMVASAAGVAAIMLANLTLFRALQWAGAAYLCWLGLELVWRKCDPDTAGPEHKRPHSAYFRRAFAVGLTNPKVLLFFVAFFPLFLRPGSSAATVGMMMVHVTLLSLAYQTILVWAGHAVAIRLRSNTTARKLATKGAGIALLGLGARLAVGQR